MFQNSTPKMIIASMFPCPLSADSCHDANSALISGSAIYAYEEEKLSTVKNDYTVKLPERSFFMGCRELGVTPIDITNWVFPVPREMPSEETFYLLFTSILKAYRGSRLEFPRWFSSNVSFVPHHISHAAISVFTSGFEECAWFTSDGGGDGGDNRSATWGEYINGQMAEHDSQIGYDGLGSFHSYLTEALGFATRENGKVSGLAGYGTVDPSLYDVLRSFLTVDGIRVHFERRRHELTPVNIGKIRPQEYCRDKVINSYPSPTNILDVCLPYLPHDIAATGEKVLKDVILEVLQWIRSRTSLRKIAFSGGLFQNVALNRAIVVSNIFEECHFPMASSDGGLALGAALYVNQGPSKKNRLGAYLGPSFAEDDVIQLCDRFRLSYTRVADAAQEAAGSIANGEVIGWFQGRAEYGPRSLGARSILADPRDSKAKNRINQLLKRREWFMPYAPAVLKECLNEWFYPEYDSPYMQVALDIASNRENEIPAAVHVDGTCRVQVVDKGENVLFWSLIDNFRSITGIPIVLNTSFNRHGIATISTPRQAIEHLLEGCIDQLFIGSIKIDFKENRRVGSQFLEPTEERQMLLDDCKRRFDQVKKFGSSEQAELYSRRLMQLISA